MKWFVFVGICLLFFSASVSAETMYVGEVVNITGFGVFVELETGIEGFIHISELSDERVEKPTDVIKKGDVAKSQEVNSWFMMLSQTGSGWSASRPNTLRTSSSRPSA